jgi:superfamily II DNA or RNA helicase
MMTDHCPEPRRLAAEAREFEFHPEQTMEDLDDGSLIVKFRAGGALEMSWHLSAFLDIDPAKIGVIRGGRRKPTGILDVAIIQSLVRNGEVSDLIADYGHVVVDECHHLSAVSFEAIARESRAKYMLGLSATVTRKDGQHPIIFMQCGPVRHRVDARKQAATRPFLHKVVFRTTGFRRVGVDGVDRPAIQNLYGLLAADEARNTLIFEDILAALEAGRSPVVITERKDHLQALADRLTIRTKGERRSYPEQFYRTSVGGAQGLSLGGILGGLDMDTNDGTESA